MKRLKALGFQSIILILLLPVACSSQHNFVKEREIHARARWVAVLPFVNLTTYPHAGRIVSDLLTTELYALTDFQIMEQTEMLDKLKGKEEDLDQALDGMFALEVGKRLGVDTVIFGSVTEFRYKRGLDEDPVVGINVRLLDVKTEKILWAGSKSKAGGCFLFCEDSLNGLALEVCRDLVISMVKE